MEQQKKSEKNTIGQKLSRFRKKKKISLEELSEKTGLMKSHLEKIEEGIDFAPVGDILKISRALAIDPDLLLQSKPRSAKEQERMRVEDFKKREASYLYDVLTPGAKNKHLRAFRVSIPARSEHPKINYQHEGEEFVYVLSGEVIVTVGQKKHHLRKNDSIHFNSGIKHALKNPGSKKTTLIVTVYTP